MGKLTQACRQGDSLTIYKALREDMAEQLECTDSGRDYAAIAKSLIACQPPSANPSRRRAAAWQGRGRRTSRS